MLIDAGIGLEVAGIQRGCLQGIIDGESNADFRRRERRIANAIAQNCNR